MLAPTRLAPTSPFALTSYFYFLLFFSLGSGSPFFPLWFHSIGISEKQVGFIAASPSFVMVLTTIFIGSLADRAKDWRTALIICNWLVALLTTGLFFVNGFYSLLLIWTFTGILMMAISPILDAAALRMANSQNTHFHKMRAFGSAGFIIGVLLAGILYEHYGIATFLYVIVGLAWCKALAGHSLPYFKRSITEVKKQGTKTTTDGQSPADASEPLINSNWPATSKQVWFLLVLLGSALIHASHAYFYTFGSILWTQSGYSTRFVSALWALGVVIEVAIMWRFADLAERYSARALLIFSAITALIRWTVFGNSPGIIALVAAQALHGLTFAIMFLATINFISKWTPLHMAARVQALSATLNTACMALTILSSGYLHAAVAEQGYWAMAAMCAIATAIIALSFRLSPGK